MNNLTIFDAHYDIFQDQYDSNKQKITESYYSINTEEIFKHTPIIQGLAAFVRPTYIGDKAFERANIILDKFYIEYAKTSSKIKIIKKSDDFEKVTSNNLYGVLLGIENGSAINGNLNNISYFYERGVRMMGVTWNPDNDLACGVATQNDTGLTSLGKKYIKSLNKHKIMIDISHASEKSVYDILDITDCPIVASHSGAKSVCNHRRNLTDNQIKKIAETGGVIGIPFYNTFLDSSGNADIRDIINHIDYIADIAGIDHVGLGTDFQLFEKHEMPNGIENIFEINKLFEEMSNEGFSNEEIAKVAGQNFINVYSKVLSKNIEKTR